MTPADIIDALPNVMAAVAASFPPGPDGGLSHEAEAALAHLLELSHDPAALARELGGGHVREGLDADADDFDNVTLLEALQKGQKYSKEAPGPGWELVSTGKRGGKIWARKAASGGEEKEKKPPEKGKTAKDAKAQAKQAVLDAVRDMAADPSKATPERLKDMADGLPLLTVPELRQARQALAASFGGAKTKQPMVDALRAHVQLKWGKEPEKVEEKKPEVAKPLPEKKEPPPKPEPKPKTTERHSLPDAVDKALLAGKGQSLDELAKATGGDREALMAHMIDLRKADKVSIGVNGKGQLTYAKRDQSADADPFITVVDLEKHLPPLKAPMPDEVPAGYTDGLPTLDVLKPPLVLSDGRRISAPLTLRDVHRLGDLINASTPEIEKAILDHFGLTEDHIKKHGSPYGALWHMTHRHYNPTSIARRVATASAAHARVAQLAAIDDRADELSRQAETGGRARSDLRNEIEDIGFSMGRGRVKDQKEKHAVRQALQEESDRRTQERDRLRAERDKAKLQVRDEAHDLLKRPDGSPATFKPDALANVPADAPLHESIQKASAWLSGLTAPDPDDGNLDAYGIHNVGDGERAHYTAFGHSCQFDPKDGAWVVVHEMGHGVERAMGGALQAAIAFRDYRCGNEPLQQLNKVLSGTKYDDDETGRKDNFDRALSEDRGWYAGKEYGSTATEIVSLGLDTLYSDPVRFARQDPEYCAFIVGILDGSLRDKPIPRR